MKYYSVEYDIRKELETPLQGHTSLETAYIVESYPYGRMRCRKRYWIEHIKGKDRLVEQTSNPKKDNLFWNKPKKSTYNWIECLYLDKNNHVQSYGIYKTYVNLKQVEIMKDLFYSILDEDQKQIVDALIKAYKKGD